MAAVSPIYKYSASQRISGLGKLMKSPFKLRPLAAVRLQFRSRSAAIAGWRSVAEGSMLADQIAATRNIAALHLNLAMAWSGAFDRRRTLELDRQPIRIKPVQMFCTEMQPRLISRFQIDITIDADCDLPRITT